MPVILALAFGSAAPLWALEDFALAWSTYLGGASSWEQARDVFVDKTGNVYVVGGTASSNFPTTVGAYDRTLSSGGGDSPQICDAFVCKFSASGTLLWSTYLGGPNYDRAYGVEVDDAGYVYVCGRAGLGFPTTPGSFQPSFKSPITPGQGYAGSQSGFVAKLSPDGSKLMWASYVGVGTLCRDIAVDGNGDIYVPLGYPHQSAPPSGSVPAEWFTNAFQKTPQGGRDCGAIKISSDGTRVLWATWLGGTGDDSEAASIRVDGSGHVYLDFDVPSTDMPTTAGAYDRTYNGGAVDFYVAKLSPDGSNLDFGTYLGGPAEEYLSTHNLALDNQGNVYASFPTGVGFPTTAGAFQRTYGGGSYDWAVVKLSPTGALIASTLIGGSGDENPDGLYVDAGGNVLITGETTSANFPVTTNAFRRVKGAGSDAVLVRLSADFSSILYGTFLGGAASDKGRSGCLGADGSLYIVGTSSGAGFPVKNAWQPNYAGGGSDGDAFVAKFIPPNPALRIQIPRLRSGSFDVTFTNLTAGIPYTVERSGVVGSGANWASVYSFNATNSEQTWGESTAGVARAFYRLLSGTR
ncbi:MAG: SBBP repeat-containing protein [Verrucomicrobiales bacterium]|nr:SBBP repeat-containing protein [Verrucomicrobiales bacterium]